jgi:3-hydroxyisobutyrate dehydrogenase-like beta-hydroxyacid dehydrogenase
MGLEMVRHMIRHGLNVFVHDISQEQMEKAVNLGAKPASSAQEAAQHSDCCLVMVATDDQVKEVVSGETGLLKGADPGYTILICSTVHPHTCQSLYELARRQQVELLDCPVVFGLAGAKEGRLKALVGGSENALKHVKPVLQTFCVDVLHMGKLGNGQITKTCNNMLHWTMIVANYEVLTLGKKYGIHPARMREVLLQCPGTNGSLQYWMESNLSWPQKDMDIALELAQDVSCSIPLHALVDQLIMNLNASLTRGLMTEPVESQ